MNKVLKFAMLGLFSASLLLAGCNQSTQNANKNETQKQTSVQTTSSNTGNVSTGSGLVVIYIDKNCETAGIPQCNGNTWKQQLSAVLGNKAKVETRYMNKEQAEKFRKMLWASPVMVIPQKDIDLFGPQAQAIKQTAKQENGKYYVPLFGWIPGEENLCNDGKDNNNDGKVDAQDPSCYKMVALTSSKCTEPYCAPEALKNMFMGYTINVVDYSSTTWKALYEKLQKINQTQYLPTFLFNNEHEYLSQMQQFVKTLTGFDYKYQINIPSFKYDPSIEACAQNCNASEACKKLLTCNKSDKPTVELFVMSHCPFGTQAEKGIIPVIKLLKDKINFQVKFVNYAMHGKKEIDENTLQYCIQKEEPNKYIDYLTCFLEKGDTKGCLQKVGIDQKKIDECIKNADTKYNITKNYNDKASWAGWRFPKYEVNNEENLKYGIQGSPTLVINGIVVQPQSRSPQAYLKAICEAFKNPPAECQKVLSNKSYDPGFGWTQSGKPAPAGSCGN